MAIPRGVVTGADGALWVANYGNDTISRMTVAGDTANFSDPSVRGPSGITAGPDGNVWFTNETGNSIGRITPAGVITSYTAAGVSAPGGITAGPDGNLWFTNTTGNVIGRITPAGVIDTFTGVGISSPQEIVSGADGALWYTNKSTNTIGRITTAGAASVAAASGLSAPEGITAGPDGNVWFAAPGGVGRITPAGIVTVMSGSSAGTHLTAGPDGNIWATDYQSGTRVTRITPAGVVTTFDGSAQRIDHQSGITPGPDGNVWLAGLGGFGDPNPYLATITPAGTITVHHDTGVQRSLSITTGPDGNVWFANHAGNKIGRLTREGVLTSFADPGIAGPVGITAGPDGNLWFTNDGNSTIGRITPAGVVTSFSSPLIAYPVFITVGADGNLWFPNRVGTIGRITPSGVVASFPGYGTNVPEAINTGPDGNVWFSYNGARAIGRITPSGVVTIFTDPGISEPFGLAPGPDGNVWFADQGGWIGRITPTGVVTKFLSPAIASPLWLAAGPDGAMWYSNSFGDSIGRISMSGVATAFATRDTVDPYSIVAGPDGRMWFTTMGNTIGRISVGVPDAPSAVTGVPGDGQVGVSWVAPGSDGGQPVVGYTVTASPGGHTCSWTSGPLSCVVPGLTNGQPYRFTVRAANTTGTGPPSAPSALVTPDVLPVITPGGTAIAEGDVGTSVLQVPVALSKPWPVAVSAHWSTAGFQAAAGSDFVGASGTVTFAPGETAKTVPVTIDGDTTLESDEQFLVTFTDGVNATIGGPYQSSFVTIIDDDALPLVVPGGASVAEGDAGSTVLHVPVRLTHAVGVPVTVPWSTLDYQANAGSDFVGATGVVTFAPGETLKAVPVVISGDVNPEPDEYVLVSFADPTNARLGGYYGLGLGLVVDDDTQPLVVPGGVGVVEGNAGSKVVSLPVTLSHAVGVPVTVSWSTMSDEATAGSDFVAASGTVTFAPGETVRTVPVTVNGDVIIEANELFAVAFSNPTNARLGGFYGLGLGLIVDDD